MTAKALSAALLALFAPLWVAAFAQPNSLQPGGFYLGEAPTGSRVIYHGRSLPLTEDNRFLIGFGRDAELTQRITLVNAAGEVSILVLRLQPRSYRVQKIDGISQKMMAPTLEDQRRIAEEAEQVYAARQISSRILNFREAFIWPLKGRITGIYGSQRVLNGEARRPHYGLDIAAPQGRPVVAPAGGIVRLVHEGMFFSGKTLVIDHGFGLSSSFLHLSKILARKGQRIAQGEKIGLVGASGRVTGPHLDWRINWLGERLDPALWVSEHEQEGAEPF